MKRKGFLGMPIVFFMGLVLVIAVVVFLVMFFTGFLGDAWEWIRGAVMGFFEFFRDLFGGVRV